MGAIAAASPSSYEALRQKKLEENKRKLEELNLSHLSVALRQASPSPKPSPVCSVRPLCKDPPASESKQVKRKRPPESAPVRRSLRLSKLPEPNYREVVLEVSENRRTRRVYNSTRFFDRVYASDEARLYAQEKAEELESELDSSFPSFVKPMLQSHTTGGFWLGLPTHFSKHLPTKDATITLIDENDEEFDTVYLANKKGLSGGWRGFSLYHDLVDGDALVFQLIRPTAFKVYIIRASSYGSQYSSD